MHVWSSPGHLVRALAARSAGAPAEGVGNECAHRAAAINARWPPPRVDTSNIVMNCNNLADVQHRLGDEHTLPQQARALQ